MDLLLRDFGLDHTESRGKAVGQTHFLCEEPNGRSVRARRQEESLQWQQGRSSTSIAQLCGCKPLRKAACPDVCSEGVGFIHSVRVHQRRMSASSCCGSTVIVLRLEEAMPRRSAPWVRVSIKVNAKSATTGVSSARTGSFV